MDNEYHHPLLYKNACITLLDSYIAIEKFIIDTRLSFIDQYKLFDLLKKLLPNEDNQLTCQGFLSWLVWRVDQHAEQQQQQQTAQPKRTLEDRMISENASVNKQLRPNGQSQIATDENDDSGCLVQYAQQQLEKTRNESSDMKQQIDRLQSVVLRLASNIDTLNQRSDMTNGSMMNFESNIKHEQMEDNETLELGVEEDHDDNEEDDEASDGNHRLNFPATTSTNHIYSMHQIPTKTIIYKGRNMMRHLRPRTTLTSFARHVASDLFSREEIMAKLHVDHNNERDVFLRHCICTAWNLTEQELYMMWPKIRNALLQLRRDAIAGKCIRMNKKKKQQGQDQDQESNPNQYNSEFDDDESQNKSEVFS